MTRFLRPVTAALLSGVLAIAGCSDDSNGPGTGHLSLLLKDAPGDILSAVVTISAINLQGSGGTTVLASTDMTTDLLTLATDAATLVQDAEVPSGSYSQLRFIISGAYIEVDNGDGTSSIYASAPDYPGLPAGATVTGNLQLPSMGQSGLKVILPGNSLTINDGSQKILVVDFDVSQSFGHPAGNSGQWVMHPVIRAENVSATGGVTVTLSPGTGLSLPAGVAITDFGATLTGSDGIPRTVAFDDTDGDGTGDAQFQFLAPGDYDLTLSLPAAVTTVATTPALPVTVTVTGGATATVAASLDSAI